MIQHLQQIDNTFVDFLPHLLLDICSANRQIMHRGQHISGIIQQLGLSKTTVAQRLKVNRTTLYNWLNDPELPWFRIKEIGEALKYDFSEDFPEFPYATEGGYTSTEDPLQRYTTLEECRVQYRRLEVKYYRLMERYLALVEKYKLDDDLPKDDDSE